MFESTAETLTLGGLLTASRSRATAHLREIITDERALDAIDVVNLMVGMKVLALATVTASGHPRISAVDGHFLHGSWTWSTSGGAAKARDLARAPEVSVAHIHGEEYALFAHGTAERLSPSDGIWDDVLGHWTTHYGGSPLAWGPDIRLYRLVPTWMVGYAFDRASLRARYGYE